MYKKLLLGIMVIFLINGCAELEFPENNQITDKVEQLGENIETIKKIKGEIEGRVTDLTNVLEYLPESVNEENLVEGTITSCYDGDTCTAVIRSTGKEEKLRFLLVDSSEIKGGPMPFAEEARDRLNELVQGKEVLLELGVGNSRDKYDRLLIYGFLSTGESIQKIMLEEGLLTVRYIYEDTKYLKEYTAAMEKAKSKEIGIWSIPGYAGYDQPFNVNAVIN
ncbi:hypothetical protein BKP35_16215 [Anaerobacillus arseniciselenatis]|uniref:TNase-like domain-containing protein n=1 Tax=Anaerobacillus arseniciselenatis TaxID=85682 RepID=A0A1S2LAG9_9BACI|nr:thermonuclease family protein [Anaerobacillus arseniciselenatis]OIJ09401.1 hypothetical protein BKP35_16215 [Anaerobacillus arseniciselenatis]